MSVAERFSRHFAALGSSALAAPELLPSRLATAATRAMTAGSAVGLSLFSDRLRVPIGTSSAAAAVAQQLQFTFGEGPCFRAYDTAAPVWASESELAGSWPVFAAQIASRTPFRAIASVPLSGGMAHLGTVDVYFNTSQDLSDEPVGDMLELAALVSGGLLTQRPRSAAAEVLAEPPWLGGAAVAARFLVPVALGMISEQTGHDFPAALALLRARAFSHEQSVDQVAADVVSRDVDITD